MHVKLKRNPPGITGLPSVETTITAQAGEGIARVTLNIFTRDNGYQEITQLVSLRLSPTEARNIAARLIDNANTSERLLEEKF